MRNTTYFENDFDYSNAYNNIQRPLKYKHITGYYKKNGQYVSKIEQVQAMKRLQQRIVFVLVLSLLMIMFHTIHVLATPTEKPVEREKFYAEVIVYPGDTLSDLSKDYYEQGGYTDMNTYIKEVMFINQLSNRNCINAGQRLVFPYYH